MYNDDAVEAGWAEEYNTNQINWNGNNVSHSAKIIALRTLDDAMDRGSQLDAKAAYIAFWSAATEMDLSYSGDRGFN